MDARMAEQLDRLERGARDTHPPRTFHNAVAQGPAYDVYVPDDTSMMLRSHETDESPHQPSTLDSFDEQLLWYADRDARRGHATSSDHYWDSHSSADAQQDLSHFVYGSTHEEAQHSFPNDNMISHEYRSNRRPLSPIEQARASRGLVLNERQEANPASQYFEQKEDGRFQSMPTASLGHVPNHAVSVPRPNHITRPQKSDITPLVVQGISIVPVRVLPDRFRTIFPYPVFNAVQSKCFDTIYRTDDNFVLSAPTGCGKTAVLELAICRLLNSHTIGSFKVVYQAPTKSLCSERQRDWQTKFGPMDLNVAELTGDTDNAHLQSVQHASILVTTPEKWDSVTRKWKDHQKLMQMVRLFLIDEVHILKEDRGATLEAVVSRMKSVETDVRFIALSATVPNSQDIATWLGKDARNPEVPAPRERFGEEFRPVRMSKHVCGYDSKGNTFAFEKVLNSRLTDLIAKYSHRKPIMIFCITRAACIATAKLLASWWATMSAQHRFWDCPRKPFTVGDKDLRETVTTGVAFHHGGLALSDRGCVEKAYLEGDISVICCTSTLAVGVNLPCHMVVVKGTETYNNNTCREYSDLEIIQMLGRAGRPQFDNSAIGVIMTRLSRVSFYEKMVGGQEILESCLHLNLIEHLNAEIGLGTTVDLSTAKRWLMGTFLFVRMKENPEHYKIGIDAPGNNLDERLENICSRGIALLKENNLVQADSRRLQCTELGDAMARYYIKFQTMQSFIALQARSKMSEILSTLAQAAEFKDVKFRAREKPVYKDLNKNGSIKYPIPVNIDLPAHKVSLIIQSVLGALELPTEDGKHRHEYNIAKATIFQHLPRLIRCIIDCQIHLQDAVSARNALVLARSFGAQVWDDSPLHLKQIEGIGLVSVRKLVAANIRSIEDLGETESHRIETILSRHPPYGTQTIEKARTFPNPRLSIKVIGGPVVHKGEHVAVRLKADVGFLNDKLPETFGRKPVYICLLVETSDGVLVHFARISARKLKCGLEVSFSAYLKCPTQTIRGHIMCDDIAGTQRSVNVKPAIPNFMFPVSSTTLEASEVDDQSSEARQPARKIEREKTNHNGFVAIDEFDSDGHMLKSKDKSINHSQQTTSHLLPSEANRESRKLASGRWECNHICTDKSSCKHLCCREGLDKPPKARPKKSQPQKTDVKQTQLTVAASQSSKKSNECLSNYSYALPTKGVKEVRDLTHLHDEISSSTPAFRMLKNISKSERTSQTTTQADGLDNRSDYGLESLNSDDILEEVEPSGVQVSPDVNILQQKYDYEEEYDDDMLDVDLAAVAVPEPDEHADMIADVSNRSLQSKGNGSVGVRRRSQQGHDEQLFDVQMSENDEPDIIQKFADKSLFVCSSDATMPSSLPAKRFALGDASPPATKKQRNTSRHLEGDKFMREVVGEIETEGAESRQKHGLTTEEWFNSVFGTEHFQYIG